jgi:hypothetical protein
MSISKIRHIAKLNLISEKRYLENKLIINETTTNSGDTITNLENQGVMVDDAQTHQTIIKQLENTDLKYKIPDLKTSVGNSDFFNKLSGIMTLKPEKNSRFERHLPQNQRTAITGEVLTFNLPNGIKLSGTYDLGSIKPNDIKVSKDVNVGNQKINLSLKSDVVSGGKTAQVGVKIPLGGRN